MTTLLRAERILVRGVNWLGDALMTTPALQRLREARPSAEITLLTPAKLADLWANHPAINKVISIPKAATWLCVAKRVRRERFDTAVIFPNSPRSAFEAFCAGIPTRIGMARPWRTWMLTHPIASRTEVQGTAKRGVEEIRRLIREQPAKPRDTFPKAAHQVHDYLRIVQELGANPSPVPAGLTVTAEEVKTIRQRFQAPVGKLLLGLNPGAEYGPAKRWPEQYFIEAARQVTQTLDCHWWIFGGVGDVAVAERILASLPVGSARSLAGQTSLRELCAALKACSALLTNDTGPMHVAAAVGTRVIVPFGSTSPELTGPGWPPGDGHDLLIGEAPCAPCFRRECPVDFRCMHHVPATQAIGAILKAVGPLQQSV